ncbi:SCAN domain-containing protein 3 [Trichonephila inaurata madagascariensis]|uniref:SCAN domain-containing protein 3 n=1 Tax=Trichonephila inaurata madagascariensis TaxID=2747483 RepID=A0A8X6X1N0_9ARAC|nr:SCAN domain-containing protein 3 [Trichonephila inaurata madagascariensis]
MNFCASELGDSPKPKPLCTVCGDQFSNEAMKPSKLLRHLNAKNPGLKDKASYLVANHIAKAKKPFTIGKELILPATKGIYHELLGEAAVEKIAHVPLSADTVTRHIEEIAEDIEAQLFESINASPWYALQVDESTDIDNRAILLAYVRYLYQEDVHEDLLCALSLPTNTTGVEMFKSLDGYISGRD